MSSTTATQGDVPLRRRFRVLERAQASLKSDGSLPLEMKHATTVEEQPGSSPTDYDTHSESSADEKERSSGGEEEGEEEEEVEVEQPEMDSPPSPPTLETKNLRRHSSHKERSPMSPRSRAWYEFDLAVVVALVSPIGNWLTGGDHIKNLLLIVLLIFYLHQIIEIPWSLYQKARPRNRAFHMPPVDPNTPEGRYAELAASELQKWELFYLFATFISPLVGALLLRYATEAILGPAAVSWFSTGLFVLATGVRPWAHLIDRLNQRTAELHDFVHYPSPSRSASEEEHRVLEERVARLETSINKLRSKMNHTSEDLLEYVDDAVDAVEHAMRKQERKWDKYEGKVQEVEQAVGQLRSGTTQHSFTSDITATRAYLRSILESILPAWAVAPTSPKSSHPTVRLPIRPLSSSSASSTPLETIVEEDDYGFETDYPALARPYSITSGLVYRAGSIAILPFRAVARMVLRNY